MSLRDKFKQKEPAKAPPLKQLDKQAMKELLEDIELNQRELEDATIYKETKPDRTDDEVYEIKLPENEHYRFVNDRTDEIFKLINQIDSRWLYIKTMLEDIDKVKAKMDDLDRKLDKILQGLDIRVADEIGRLVGLIHNNSDEIKQANTRFNKNWAEALGDIEEFKKAVNKVNESAKISSKKKSVKKK